MLLRGESMADRKKIHFIISIVMLMAGMTAGFLLLSVVYTGSQWVRLAVLAAYVFVSAMVIKFSKRYIKMLSERKK